MKRLIWVIMLLGAVSCQTIEQTAHSGVLISVKKPGERLEVHRVKRMEAVDSLFHRSFQMKINTGEWLKQHPPYFQVEVGGGFRFYAERKQVYKTRKGEVWKRVRKSKK